TSNCPGIRDFHGNLSDVVCGNFLRSHSQITIFECCIAEAESKGVQRFRAFGQDIMPKCTWLLVVVAGELSDRAGKGDGEFAAGVHAAEYHVCYSMTGFFSQVPALHNRRSLFL